MLNDHHAASSLVRCWRPQSAGDAFGLDLKQEGRCHVFTFKGEGYLVQVSFSELNDKPNVMRVRSTNWRCEHEPSGLFYKDDCRAFCKQLLRTGFVCETREPVE